MITRNILLKSSILHFAHTCQLLFFIIILQCLFVYGYIIFTLHVSKLAMNKYPTETPPLPISQSLCELVIKLTSLIATYASFPLKGLVRVNFAGLCFLCQIIPFWWETHCTQPYPSVASSQPRPYS